MDQLVPVVKRPMMSADFRSPIAAYQTGRTAVWNQRLLHDYARLDSAV